MFYKESKIAEGKTLEELYKISYRDPLKVPVSVSISGNDIKIRAFVRFEDTLMRPFRGRSGGEIDDGVTYADVICEGIKKNWSGTFDMPGINGKVVTAVELIREDDPASAIPEGQRILLIRRGRMGKYSYVSSPWYRKGWGIFINICPESAMVNWSPYQTGRINMAEYKYKKTYMSVASHEFGHILGIGDAYGAHYRLFYEYPGTADYMMNSNRTVNPKEILMMLRAHETKRMQYFPFVFVPKTYFSHLWKNIRSLFKK